jgi:hypothetical protein
LKTKSKNIFTSAEVQNHFRGHPGENKRQSKNKQKHSKPEKDYTNKKRSKNKNRVEKEKIN